jgi:hypothetical protein
MNLGMLRLLVLMGIGSIVRKVNSYGESEEKGDREILGMCEIIILISYGGKAKV